MCLPVFARFQCIFIGLDSTLLRKRKGNEVNFFYLCELTCMYEICFIYSLNSRIDEKVIITAGGRCFDNDVRKISHLFDVDSYDLDKNRNGHNIIVKVTT